MITFQYPIKIPARLFTAVLFAFFFGVCRGGNHEGLIPPGSVGLDHTLEIKEQSTFYANTTERPNPILQLIRIKQKKNKKITAAILAFPFPFGIVGLHRIYLGTAPYVPVVYIATLGGVLGILPFIDFCVIALDKNIDRFIENKKVVMWVDENKKTGK